MLLPKPPARLAGTSTLVSWAPHVARASHGHGACDGHQARAPGQLHGGWSSGSQALGWKVLAPLLRPFLGRWAGRAVPGQGGQVPLVGSGECESLSQHLRTPSLGRKRWHVGCAGLTRSPDSLQPVGRKRDREPHTPRDVALAGGWGEPEAVSVATAPPAAAGSCLGWGGVGWGWAGSAPCACPVSLVLLHVVRAVCS